MPSYHSLALLGSHPILHISRISVKVTDFHHITYTQKDTFRATWKGLCVKELCRSPHQQFEVCMFYTRDYFQIFVLLHNNFYLNPIIIVAWFSKQNFQQDIPVCYSSIFCSYIVALCAWIACCGLIESGIAYRGIKIIPGLLHFHFKHYVKNFMIFRNYWDITQEDRHYIPEKQHKAIRLNKHPKKGPTQQHYRYPTKKCYWCLYFMLLEKKSEGSFQPNYTCQACNE